MPPLGSFINTKNRTCNYQGSMPLKRKGPSRPLTPSLKKDHYALTHASRRDIELKRGGLQLTWKTEARLSDASRPSEQADVRHVLMVHAKGVAKMLEEIELDEYGPSRTGHGFGQQGTKMIQCDPCDSKLVFDYAPKVTRKTILEITFKYAIDFNIVVRKLKDLKIPVHELESGSLKQVRKFYGKPTKLSDAEFMLSSQASQEIGKKIVRPQTNPRPSRALFSTTSNMPGPSPPLRSILTSFATSTDAQDSDDPFRSRSSSFGGAFMHQLLDPAISGQSHSQTGSISGKPSHLSFGRIAPYQALLRNVPQKAMPLSTARATFYQPDKSWRSSAVPSYPAEDCSDRRGKDVFRHMSRTQFSVNPTTSQSAGVRNTNSPILVLEQSSQERARPSLSQSVGNPPWFAALVLASVGPACSLWRAAVRKLTKRLEGVTDLREIERIEFELEREWDRNLEALFWKHYEVVRSRSFHDGGGDVGRSNSFTTRATGLDASIHDGTVADAEVLDTSGSSLKNSGARLSPAVGSYGFWVDGGSHGSNSLPGDGARLDNASSSGGPVRLQRPKRHRASPYSSHAS